MLCSTRRLRAFVHRSTKPHRASKACWKWIVFASAEQGTATSPTSPSGTHRAGVPVRGELDLLNEAASSLSWSAGATDYAGLDGLVGPADGPQAIGLVVPGLVDDRAGVARYSENIGWRDVSFRSILEERSGLPIGFGHDVRAGGLAERTLGAGSESAAPTSE